MIERTWSIIFSNLTGQRMAWPGTAKSQSRFLGNRVVIGEVSASSQEMALQKWNEAQLPQLQT
ncbi:hypothetical protein [Comamonas thiooxydans]|uniref:hypothetical protein n=1 Tax=Comamonas thiooxydans TaxID=363952 RepID=UPI00103F563D|nr:hypothetical protein [Comamonas thiooxydans]